MPELIAAIDAFLQEHRRCDELDDGVEGERAWMTCDCGAVLSRDTASQTDARPPG